MPAHDIIDNRTGKLVDHLGQMPLLLRRGAVFSRDVPMVVGTVKCAPDAKAADLPDGYSTA